MVDAREQRPGAATRPLRSRIGKLAAAAVALVALVVAIVGLARPKQGQLVVTVSGPNQVAVGKLQVMIDGEPKCTESPCRVTDLAAGVHLVRIEAPGYRQAAERAANVSHEEETAVAFTLVPKVTTAELRVPALGQFLRLAVDGQDRGPLPAEVKGLKPGEHLLKISGNERYARFEKRVSLEAGQALAFAPKLQVLQGRAHIQPGNAAEGARVTIECVGKPRLVIQPPVSVDVAADGQCMLVAIKAGFPTLEIPLTFDDGKASKTFTVDLQKPKLAKNGDRAKVDDLARFGLESTQDSAPAEQGATGTISINSIPVSSVLVDGRPAGTTPTQATVAPGPHTVIFIHAGGGRKTVSVNVKAGGIATATVRFEVDE